MVIRAGVWIDHQKAAVVLNSEGEEEIKRVKSGVPRRARTAAGSRSKNRYTPNDFVAEDRLERKFTAHLDDFYKKVIDCTRGVEAILILGRGEAKGELSKHILAKNPRRVTVEVEAVEKMTDSQIAAKVRQHFLLDRGGSKKTRSSGSRSKRPAPRSKVRR